jgi:hypothetical protein
MSRRFDPVLLESLRSMSVTEALNRLGLHWKRDPDFRSRKDQTTQRLYVTVGARVFEIIATGARWYDTRAERGGGGAIDLAMYILRLSFVDAVKRLSR